MPSELRAEMSRAAALAIPVWVDARERERLRGVPAGAAREPRAAAALHRVLRRRLRRAVRRRCSTTTSAGMTTAEVRDALRLPEGAPGAARQGGRRRRAGRRAGRAELPARAAEAVRARGGAAVRLRRRRRGGSTRPCIRSRRGAGTQRHPDHDALLRGQPRRPLRDDARVRARPLRAPGRPARSSARRSARGVSLGMHESQSRMWENLVGRSLPFWRFFFPRLQELFPDALARLRRRVAGTARSTPSSRR